MAFWGYDLFPHVLCDEVKFIQENGAIVPEHYGGHCFRPFTVMPLAEGQRIKEKLDELEAEHRQATIDLNESFRLRRRQLMPKNKKEFSEAMREAAQALDEDSSHRGVRDLVAKADTDFYVRCGLLPKRKPFELTD